MSEKTPFIKTIPKLSVLLVFLPVAVWLHYSGNNGMALFVCSALGILGTVTLIGKSTEEIAVYAGPLWGGLLNATFGNVTELIIALFALQKGLHGVVLSSITGSILGNLLLVLGAAMIYGGTKYPTQKFSRAGAQINVGMLWIAILVIMVPSLMSITIQLDPKLAAEDIGQLMRNVSLSGAVILLVLYFAGLLFSMKTHKFLFMPGDEEQHEAQWSKGTAIGILLGATVAVAWLSELFVGSIEHLVTSGAVDISEMFIGVIVVALVGNAAEGTVAIWVARENKMELSFQIAMGSCLQVALMVAPVLVIASCFIGPSFMPLKFNPFELLALFAATMIASASLNDGETNWLEGTMLVGVYIFFALVFWFHP
jgi:Ca2+:H+ antiporter